MKKFIWRFIVVILIGVLFLVFKSKRDREAGYCFNKGVKMDYTEAAKWYRKAAEQGDADAQNNLGLCYERGQGVPEDYEEAVKWYRKAAAQGHAGAKKVLKELNE